MSFNNLRIAAKLWLALSVFVFLFMSLIVFSGVRSNEIIARTDGQILESNARVRAATHWAGLAETLAARTQAAMISSDPKVEHAFNQANKTDQAKVAALQTSLEALVSSDAERQQLGRIADAAAMMKKHAASISELRSADDEHGASELFERDFMPSVNAYLSSVWDLANMLERQAKELQAAIAAERKSTVKIAAIMAVLIFGASFIGSVKLIRSLREPLVEAVAAASRIAQGDLTMQLETARRDEFGDLMRALKKMNDSLNHVVGQVRTSTQSVVTASTQIAAGNMDLSSRTEHQASSLQETASSMEELTSAVNQNADNARQANRMAGSAAEVATRGGLVVSQVVETMASINASSKKIVDITGVIDSIAFQTNILALNAAVEAARAGEQGRGFAVVASEVRNLAQRSAGAAREIKALIDDSVAKVGDGARLVDEAGATIQELVESVRRMTDIMAEISSASQEQTVGIGQVNQAIVQMDHVTQQNAALVEEAAAAAKSMQEQADNLSQVVDIFKVKAA